MILSRAILQITESNGRVSHVFALTIICRLVVDGLIAQCARGVIVSPTYDTVASHPTMSSLSVVLGRADRSTRSPLAAQCSRRTCGRTRSRWSLAVECSTCRGPVSRTAFGGSPLWRRPSTTVLLTTPTRCWPRPSSSRTHFTTWDVIYSRPTVHSHDLEFRAIISHDLGLKMDDCSCVLLIGIFWSLNPRAMTRCVRDKSRHTYPWRFGILKLLEHRVENVFRKDDHLTV